MTRTATAVLALLSGLAATTPLRAQDVILLDEITVTGAQEAQQTRRSGVSVSVVDARQLEKTTETRLTDVLARLPGIGILSRGPMGTQTGLTLRGVSQNYVKVLVDGIDVGDPSAPQVAYDFGRLGTSGIDRLEVLRGSQSAIYGSQAIAGVISLGTPLPAEQGTHGKATVEMGSYDTRLGSLTVGHRTDAGALGFTLTRSVSDGFSAADKADGNTENDGYDSTRLSVRGETTLDNGVTLGFAGFIEDAVNEFDPQFPLDPTTLVYGSLGDGETYDEQADALSRGLRVYAGFQTGAVEHTVDLTRFRIRRESTGSEYAALYDMTWTPVGSYLQDTNFSYVGERTKLAWKGAADVGPGRLVFGADTSRETYDSVILYTPDPDMYSGASDGGSTIAGVFAEYAFAPMTGVDVTASLRRDDHSRFGGFTTGRIAAAWQASPDLTVRAALGSGFRAPSGYELYGPYGDPDLKPEESVSADLGVEKRWGDAAALRATLFWIETDNLIDYVWPGYMQIDGTTRRQGIEVEGEVAVTERMSLIGSYTYTDASNPVLSGGNTWNAGFGRHQLALGLDAQLNDRLTANLGLLHVADRPTLPDYTIATTTLTMDMGRSTEGYLRVENLFDEKYQLWQGYGTSGRAVYVGLRKTF